MNTDRKKRNKIIKYLSVLTMLFFLIFFSTTCMYAAENEKSDNSRFIVVSLGDSYSSGEGIPDFYGQSDSIEDCKKSDDWVAHRSKHSWPGLLRFSELNNYNTTLAERRDKENEDERNKNWYFFAASGAETKHLNNTFVKEIRNPSGSETEKHPLDPQIEEAMKNVNPEDVDYVTISIGGNDADFAKIISYSVLFGKHLLPNLLFDKLNKVWMDYDKKDGIKANLENTYNKLCSTFPNAVILVAGYPKLLNQSGGLCISEEEAELINKNVSYFNNEIEQLVYDLQKEGKKIHFIPVEKAFEGRGAYTKYALINNIKLPQKQDINLSEKVSSYSMHPNEEGARKYAECVQNKIDVIEQSGHNEVWSDETVIEVLDYHGKQEGDFTVQIEGRSFYSCNYPRIFFQVLNRYIPVITRIVTMRPTYHTKGVGVEEYSETIGANSPEGTKINLRPGNYTISIINNKDTDQIVKKTVTVVEGNSNNHVSIKTTWGNDIPENALDYMRPLVTAQINRLRYDGDVYYTSCSDEQVFWETIWYYCSSNILNDEKVLNELDGKILIQSDEIIDMGYAFFGDYKGNIPEIDSFLEKKWIYKI